MNWKEIIRGLNIVQNCKNVVLRIFLIYDIVAVCSLDYSRPLGQRHIEYKSSLFSLSHEQILCGSSDYPVVLLYIHIDYKDT